MCCIKYGRDSFVPELIDVNYWEDPRYKLVLDDLE